jgi:hypothetical protein
MAESNMLKGLTKSCPPPPSDKPKGESVNSESTRTTAATSPKSLGPRCA